MRLASVMPVWYALFWCGLTTAVCLFGWLVGPHIIARGLEIWMRGNK